MIMKTLAVLVIVIAGLAIAEAIDDSFVTFLNDTAHFYMEGCNKTNSISPEDEKVCNNTFDAKITTKPECQVLNDMDVCLKATCINVKLVDDSIHGKMQTFCCGPYLRPALFLVLLLTLLGHFISTFANSE